MRLSLQQQSSMEPGPAMRVLKRPRSFGNSDDESSVSSEQIGKKDESDKVQLPSQGCARADNKEVPDAVEHSMLDISYEDDGCKNDINGKRMRLNDAPQSNEFEAAAAGLTEPSALEGSNGFTSHGHECPVPTISEAKTFGESCFDLPDSQETLCMNPSANVNGFAELDGVSSKVDVLDTRERIR
eukprot:61079-Karenia_brevis.AAC.1